MIVQVNVMLWENMYLIVKQFSFDCGLVNLKSLCNNVVIFWIAELSVVMDFENIWESLLNIIVLKIIYTILILI